MKYKILLNLITILCATATFAQSKYGIKGTTNDSVSNVKLHNSSIAVLNAKDSTLVTYTRTTEDGSFIINGLNKGKYILLVAYPDYADYVENFSLDSIKQSHDFGSINMQLKARLLNEVIIKSKVAAIKIKGDTTEFNARAFTVQPNAKVEDLLKQLPGIQVDNNGKITAQGQTVNKVLVDGEEFFGDDPTLVTKNLRADMVDKVQLYDKKSDQATFTGIDDGKKTKTLNIKLKEGKKNGYFGKIEADGGTDGYYSGQVLFNRFKGKQKFSVYGTFGNTGKTGLGWEDNQKYGSIDGNVEFDDGTITISSNGDNDDLDSFNGGYGGQGLPLAITGGLHYDTRWDNDKQSLNANYKIGTITIDGTQNNINQQNNSNFIKTDTTAEKSHKYLFRQKLDVTYQTKLDTSSNLKLTLGGGQKHSESNSNNIGISLRNDTLLNKSARSLTSNTNQGSFYATAFYTKKFKKTGRTLSLKINESYNQSESKGYLYSKIDYYNPNPAHIPRIDSTSIINQYKTNNIKSNTLNSNLTYTESLSKSLNAIFNYGIGLINNTSDRETFNASTPNNYNVFVGSLSNNYKINQLSNQLGTNFNYKKGKSTLTFGTKLVDVNYHQIDEFTNTTRDRSFINWAPEARYQYRFSQQKSLSVSYNGNETQPTIDQLQPLNVNNDPLNIVVGNPNLKPSFTNRFNFNYNSYKVLTNQYIYLYGDYSFTSNPIVSNITTDPATGKNTIKTFNLTDKNTSNYYFGINTNKKIEKLDVSVGLSLNGNGDIYYTLSNNVLNRTTSYGYSAGWHVSKYKEKKYSFYLRGSPTYTINESSLNPNINNNAWGFNANGSFTIYLPSKFQLSSDGDYQYTAKTKTFSQNFSKTIINASLSKTFLKAESLKLSLTCNDLLNQNTGFDRSASGGYFTQNKYTTIKRYFMLAISYDFNKIIGGAQNK